MIGPYTYALVIVTGLVIVRPAASWTLRLLHWWDQATRRQRELVSQVAGALLCGLIVNLLVIVGMTR